MDWPVPMDGQFAVYAYGPPLAAGLAALAAALFGFEVATGRLRLAGRRGAVRAGLLLAGLVAAGGAFWTIVQALREGTPAWDAMAQEALRGPGVLDGLARAVSWAASLPFALLALFTLFLWAARRKRWPEAYFALAAGPGLALLLVTVKVTWPRWPPGDGFQPFFRGPNAFANDAACLAVAALVVWGILRARMSPGRRVPWPALALAGILVALAPVVAGYAWPSDALAGLALAGAWLAACMMGLHLADGWGQHPTSIGHRIVAGLDRLMQAVVARPMPWLAGLIALGVVLRIASYWFTPLAVDAYAYAAMAQSFVETGTFTMPWGDVGTYHTEPAPSHHYPPLYPVYLAAFYAVFGFSDATTNVAAIVSSLAAMLVTYLCTRDLYGRIKGVVATAIVAVSPILVQNTGQGYSENLVMLFFVATLWAILKSLDRPWFIVAAGLFAGLGYLTKSTMGPFFIVAGLGGLAWRLYWKGPKVLRDPPYVTAIVCFGALVVAWALRNIRLFGSWDTSFHITDAYQAALADPLGWGYYALVTFVFYATAGYLLYLALLPWLPRLTRIPKLDSEHDSGLWLALGLPLILTASIDACLWLIEREFFVNNVRYVAFVTAPAVWLLLRHASPALRGVRLATLVTVALLVVGSLFFAKPQVAATQEIADDLAARMMPGDSVGFVDNNNHFVYRFYFQLTADGTRDVDVQIGCLRHPLCPPDALRVGELNTTWILAQHYAIPELPPGYTQVLDAQAKGDPAHPEYLTLWRRDA